MKIRCRFFRSQKKTYFKDFCNKSKKFQKYIFKMGKKGKGNKLAKMSEEERARYLQLRADIEEEARRRKMQLISMYMKVIDL